MKIVKFLVSVRFLITFAIVSILSALAYPVQAQSVMKNTQSVPTLSVNFLGEKGDKLFFEVIVAQPAESRSVLRIRDEDGTQLYSELVKGTSLLKRIQLPRHSMKKLEFVVDSGKEELKKAFEINIHYLEQLSVKDITRL